MQENCVDLYEPCKSIFVAEYCAILSFYHTINCKIPGQSVLRHNILLPINRMYDCKLIHQCNK